MNIARYESLMSGIVETGNVILNTKKWPRGMLMFINVFTAEKLWVALAELLYKYNREYISIDDSRIFYNIIKSPFPLAISCVSNALSVLLPSFYSSTSIILAFQPGSISWSFTPTENHVVVVMHGIMLLNMSFGQSINLPSASVTFIPAMKGVEYMLECVEQSLVMIFG